MNLNRRWRLTRASARVRRRCWCGRRRGSISSLVNRHRFGEYQAVLLVVEKVGEILGCTESYSEGEHYRLDCSAPREYPSPRGFAGRQRNADLGLGNHERRIADADLITRFKGNWTRKPPSIYERPIRRAQVGHLEVVLSECNRDMMTRYAGPTNDKLAVLSTADHNFCLQDAKFAGFAGPRIN